MKKTPDSLNDAFDANKQGKDTKERDQKQLLKVLFEKPISRRMAAFLLGKGDKTYCVTQYVHDFIESGHIQVVGKIRCKRSDRFVEAITSNPKYFRKKDDNREILWK